MRIVPNWNNCAGAGNFDERELIGDSIAKGLCRSLSGTLATYLHEPAHVRRPVSFWFGRREYSLARYLCLPPNVSPL